MGGESVFLDLYDFILSQNILVLGALVYISYASFKYGWGFDKFVAETNKGDGIKLSPKLKFYFKYVLPIIVLVLFVQGYMSVFNK